jgi:hypothetical protein
VSGPEARADVANTGRVRAGFIMNHAPLS